MVKGKQKEEFMKIEEIYKLTSGGYDIFKYYLGNIAKIMNRPWGKREKKLSWGVFPVNGIWFWKDAATGDTGTAVQFVEKYFDLSFTEARDKICWDFGLGGKEKNVSPVIITWEKPNIERDYTIIECKFQPFAKKHHEFWNAAGVTEEHCKKYNTFAVKTLAINKRRVNLRRDEIVFAYWAPEENSFKIYFPEREDNRFKNNVSGHYLWNFSNIQECDNLIIQKSMKDLLVTTLITPCCIATQNESSGIFDEEMVGKINSITKTPWIWYGSDWDGVKKCKAITDTNKWKYINTPKNLLPEINDAYSFVKKFGIKALENFMRSKKLI